MSTFLIVLLISFLLSLAIALLAAWRGSLSRSGAVAATLVGTVTLGFGGWHWGLLLGFFFVSSSLLSHLKADEKRVAAEKFAKGHRRDWAQVLANGGLGTILALLNAAVPAAHWFLLFSGVMATVTADTWATELGTLSKRRPRMITTGRVVEVGTSGAISPLGTLVSFLGGLAIGIFAGMTTELPLLAAALMGGLSGLAGSLADSLLGATVQRIYYSQAREKETEKRYESDGTPNRPLRGWAWMNNDVVNLLASILGGLAALALSLLLLSL